MLRNFSISFLTIFITGLAFFEFIQFSLAVLVLVLLLIHDGKINIISLKYISPLIGIAIVGILGAFINRVDLYTSFKDVYYFSKPFVLFLVGFYLAKKTQAGVIFNSIIFAGVISALFHFYELFSSPSLYQLSFLEIRDLTKNASLIEAISFSGLLYGYQNKKLKISRYYIIVLLTLLLISSLLYFSRIQVVVLIILSLTCLGYFKLNAKTITYLSILSLLLVLIFNLEYQENSTMATFIEKFKQSFDEVALITDQDIRYTQGVEWRSYEASKAFQQLELNDLSFVFGKGFGSFIDLGGFYQVGENYHREISKIHNGFVRVLFKTGIVGLLFYCYFVFRQIYLFYRIKSFKEIEWVKRLGLGLALSIIPLSLAIGGIYNKSSLNVLLIILGSLAYYSNYYSYYENRN